MTTGRRKNGERGVLEAGDDSRKLCGLYLEIVDRMGVRLDQFGDAESHLVDF